jgi:hypothetical protein
MSRLKSLFGAPATAPTASPAPNPLRDGSLGVADVRYFGATGIIGDADDTPAFDRAALSLPGVGIVQIPPGVYRVKNLSTFGKSIIFRGCGWGCAADGRPGAQVYRDFSPMNGSILYCNAMTGAAIQFDVNFRVNFGIRDLAIIGADVPGVTGVAMNYRAIISNVLIANFDTGLAIKNVVGAHVSDTWLRGCNTGLDITYTTVSQFDRCTVTQCAKNAVIMRAGYGLQFNTLDTETNHCTGPEILIDGDGDPAHGSFQNTFNNSWAESGDNAGGLLFDITAAAHGTAINQINVHGGTAERIRDRGAGTILGPMYSWPWGGGDLMPLPPTTQP